MVREAEQEHGLVVELGWRPVQWVAPFAGGTRSGGRSVAHGAKLIDQSVFPSTSMPLSQCSPGSSATGGNCLTTVSGRSLLFSTRSSTGNRETDR